MYNSALTVAWAHATAHRHFPEALMHPLLHRRSPTASPENALLGAARSGAKPLALAALAVLAAGAAVGQPKSTAAAGCAGNVLANPSFDGGSRKTQALGTSLSSAVADGWIPWFVRGNEAINREPEFKVEQVALGGDPGRVRSGGQSQKWFTTWATHDAGIYQQVRTSPGSSLKFTAYAMVYTGEADGWSDERHTFLSDPAKPGNYRVSVGIDPGGATPAGMGAPPPASVVWSAPSMATDDWVPLSVSTVARAQTVTVYARGAPEWPVKHNDSFWEDACLEVTGRAARSGSGSGGMGSAPRSGAGGLRAAPSPRDSRVPGASHGFIPR
jgi:hypothetical protein